jgi:hypothetical protein
MPYVVYLFQNSLIGKLKFKAKLVKYNLPTLYSKPPLYCQQICRRDIQKLDLNQQILLHEFL